LAKQGYHGELGILQGCRSLPHLFCRHLLHLLPDAVGVTPGKVYRLQRAVRMAWANSESRW
jgi:hypothetical protein